MAENNKTFDKKRFFESIKKQSIDKRKPVRRLIFNELPDSWDVREKVHIASLAARESSSPSYLSNKHQNMFEGVVTSIYEQDVEFKNIVNFFD